MTAPPFIESRHRVWLQAFHNVREQEGRPPTLRDLCRPFNTTTTSVVAYRLKALVEAGYLQRLGTDGTTRNHDISEKGMAALGLRLAGVAGDIDGGGCL